MKKLTTKFFSTTPSVVKKGMAAMLCMVVVGLFLIAGCIKDKPVVITGGNGGQGQGSDPETSLEGTKWKLVGIVDAETKELKEFEPKEWENDDELYRLTFDTDSTLSGKGVCNILYGKYEIDYTVNNIHILMWTSTLAANLFDENLYLESLNNVYYFSVQEKKELHLYFNRHNYLLFILLEP